MNDIMNDMFDVKNKYFTSERTKNKERVVSFESSTVSIKKFSDEARKDMMNM